MEDQVRNSEMRLSSKYNQLYLRFKYIYMYLNLYSIKIKFH